MCLRDVYPHLSGAARAVGYRAPGIPSASARGAVMPLTLSWMLLLPGVAGSLLRLLRETPSVSLLVLVLLLLS